MNFYRMLRPFFADPCKFRSLQGGWDALIIDHGARSFFKMSAKPYINLELLIRTGCVLRMVKYLESEGYFYQQFDASSANLLI